MEQITWYQACSSSEKAGLCVTLQSKPWESPQEAKDHILSVLMPPVSSTWSATKQEQGKCLEEEWVERKCQPEKIGGGETTKTEGCLKEHGAGPGGDPASFPMRAWDLLLVPLVLYLRNHYLIQGHEDVRLDFLLRCYMVAHTCNSSTLGGRGWRIS